MVALKGQAHYLLLVALHESYRIKYSLLGGKAFKSTEVEQVGDFLYEVLADTLIEQTP